MIQLYKYLFVIICQIGLVEFGISQTINIYVKNYASGEYSLEKQSKFADSLEITNFLQQNLSSDISKAYVLAGYDSIVYDSTVVRAYYNRGKKYVWESVKFNDTLIARTRLPEQHDLFDPEILFAKMKDLVRLYADSGYPFAEIKLWSLNFKTNKVSCEILVEPGDIYFFDSIIIKGEPKIKSYYIYKAVGLKKGDRFSFSDISNLDRQIKMIPFIEQNRPYQLAFAENKTDILLYLKNKKASSFNGLIGIMPNNQTSGKLMITGDINLYLLNNAGIGELFLFKWQKYESYSQNLKTKVSLPYLFKSDFGTAVSFDIEKKDSTYVNTDFSGAILYGSNTGNGIQMYYRNISSYLLDTAETNNDNLYDFTTNLYGLGYRFLNTDDIFHPRKGWIINITTEFGVKAISGNEEIGKTSFFQTRNSADISYYIPIGNYMSLKIRNLTSSIYSKNILDNELFRLGGLNTLRGFDELSIPTSSFSMGSIELSYLFEEKSVLFAFIDGAYFEKRFTADDFYNYAGGTGVGLDLNTSAGTFTIVFAIGKQNNSNISIINSKIHFGYRNSF